MMNKDEFEKRVYDKVAEHKRRTRRVASLCNVGLLAVALPVSAVFVAHINGNYENNADYVPHASAAMSTDTTAADGERSELITEEAFPESDGVTDEKNPIDESVLPENTAQLDELIRQNEEADEQSAIIRSLVLVYADGRRLEGTLTQSELAALLEGLAAIDDDRGVEAGRLVVFGKSAVLSPAMTQYAEDTIKSKQ